MLKRFKSGEIQLSEEALEDVQKHVDVVEKYLTMQNHDFMKVFDCKSSWPICMFDYAFKSKTNDQ